MILSPLSLLSKLVSLRCTGYSKILSREIRMVVEVSFVVNQLVRSSRGSFIKC